MVQCSDTTSFYAANLSDLQRFVNYSNVNHNDSSDVIQDFFLYNCERNALANWDASRASYSTYVFTVLRWQMQPYTKYNRISQQTMPETMPDETTDISMRVRELADYIRKHGGDYVERLLNHLHKRVQGFPLTEDDKYIEILFHKLVRAFKMAEKV